MPPTNRPALFMEAEQHGPNASNPEYRDLDFHEALYWATITLTS